MIVLMNILFLFIVANALESKKEINDAEVKNIFIKYLNKTHDIESQYVINEGLSKAISHYFNGKIRTFPLYKISLKIDRNPVKIPWSLGQVNNDKSIKTRVYKYVKPKKNVAK